MCWLWAGPHQPIIVPIIANTRPFQNARIIPPGPPVHERPSVNRVRSRLFSGPSSPVYSFFRLHGFNFLQLNSMEVQAQSIEWQSTVNRGGRAVNRGDAFQSAGRWVGGYRQDEWAPSPRVVFVDRPPNFGRFRLGTLQAQGSWIAGPAPAEHPSISSPALLAHPSPPLRHYLAPRAVRVSGCEDRSL